MLQKTGSESEYSVTSVGGDNTIIMSDIIMEEASNTGNTTAGGQA